VTYRQQTIKQLFALSGNRCAFPKCTTPLIEGETTLGEICHICAASPQGPRYDPNQTPEDRDAVGNLILFCPTHHKVVDDDVESYTVVRLRKMKADHEAAPTTISDIEAVGGATLLIDKSVEISHQSGGLAAHTVNTGSIHISNTPADDRAAKAAERLWLILLELRKEFSDVTFVETILIPDELSKYFRGTWSHELLRTVESYADELTVLHKMQRAGFENAQKERTAISSRLWSIYFSLQAIYGRVGMLYTFSFKRREYQDWRKDHGIDQHLRAILPSQGVDTLKADPNIGLQQLVGMLENLFLEVARSNQR
jgi:hypothetical protein